MSDDLVTLRQSELDQRIREAKADAVREIAARLPARINHAMTQGALDGMKMLTDAIAGGLTLEQAVDHVTSIVTEPVFVDPARDN
jgi:hypothetical protein